MPKLSRIDSSISVSYTKTVNWYVMADADIFYIERPVHKEHFEAIQIAKDFGIPVWIDIDDNYFEIPYYNKNPHMEFMQSQGKSAAIASALQSADHITVTTDELREFYKKINRNVTVIPNAFNDYNYKLEYKYSDKKTKTIVWRGSDSHGGDMEFVKYPMWRSAKNNPEWTWKFVGFCHPKDRQGVSLWQYTKGMKRYESHPWMAITDYFYYTKNLNHSIQVFPLIENSFNLAKSNCSWIEATYSGAAFIGPDYPEFRRPGITNYDTKQDKCYMYNETRDISEDPEYYNYCFMDKVQELIDNEKLREDKYNESFDYIRDNLMLKDINKKRVEVAHKIMGKHVEVQAETIAV